MARHGKAYTHEKVLGLEGSSLSFDGVLGDSGTVKGDDVLLVFSDLIFRCSVASEKRKLHGLAAGSMHR